MVVIINYFITLENTPSIFKMRRVLNLFLDLLLKFYRYKSTIVLDQAYHTTICSEKLLYFILKSYP